MISKLNIVMMTTMPEVTLGHSVTGRGRDSALARHILTNSHDLSRSLHWYQNKYQSAGSCWTDFPPNFLVLTYLKVKKS